MQIAGYLNQMTTQVYRRGLSYIPSCLFYLFRIFYQKVSSLFQLPIYKMTQSHKEVGVIQYIDVKDKKNAQDERLRVNSQSNNNKLKLTNSTLRIEIILT